MKNSSSGSTFLLAVLCTFGVLIIIGMIGNSMTPKCSRSGCDRDRADGSNYCYLHKSYSGHSSSRKSSSSSGSSYSKSNGSSTTKSSGSAGSSSRSASNSRLSTYDDGYEAIYEDDDYDWDRYQTDNDYADGVDDAMDELDW